MNGAHLARKLKNASDAICCYGRHILYSMRPVSFDIKISFRSFTENGIIFYAQGSKDNDFISLTQS